METANTVLTSSDVFAALEADGYLRLAKAEGCSVESLVYEEEETRKGQHAETIQRVRHGVELLKSYRVVRSQRTTVGGGRFSGETTIASPIVEVDSGHIGAAEAYRFVALAKRK